MPFFFLESFNGFIIVRIKPRFLSMIDPKIVFLKQIQVVAKKVKQVLAFGISLQRKQAPLRNGRASSV